MTQPRVFVPTLISKLVFISRPVSSWVSQPVTPRRTTDTTDMTHNCFPNISSACLGHIIRTQICFLNRRHSQTRRAIRREIIITSFSAEHAPHLQQRDPEAVGAVRSKATTCEAFPSNRSVGKRPRAAEHGRSLNGCKPQSLSGYKAPARGMKALLQCLRENNKGVSIPAGPTCLHRFLGWWIW